MWRTSDRLAGNMVSMASYDAILIPGGGLRNDGDLPPWVRNRLDKAVEIDSTRFFMTLSRGTSHKAPPSDEEGFPIDESLAGARYLIARGISKNRILFEATSFDTIGNAFFSRLIHIEPMRLVRLLIITSNFHLARTRAIFNWVYSLSDGSFDLTFAEVPNVGIDADSLHARMEKERQGLQALERPMRQISTLEHMHQWLFFQHNAYKPDGERTEIGDAIKTY